MLHLIFFHKKEYGDDVILSQWIGFALRSWRFIIIRAARVWLFPVVSVCDFVCLFVCLSVNTITPEPLQILSRNFQGIILWSKWQTSSKMTVMAVSTFHWSSVWAVFKMSVYFVFQCCSIVYYGKWRRFKEQTVIKVFFSELKVKTPGFLHTIDIESAEYRRILSSRIVGLFIDLLSSSPFLFSFSFVNFLFDYVQ